MTIHAPVHPSHVAPQAHHHYFAWTVVTAAIVLAIGAVLLVPADGFRITTPNTNEQSSLIEYRAYERAAWAASEANPEWNALVEFRAAEREGR